MVISSTTTARGFSLCYSLIPNKLVVLMEYYIYIYTYHISPQKVAFIVKQLPNLWSSHEAALDPSGIPRVGLPEENHIYIIYTYIYTVYIYILVGGLEHFLFSIIYGIILPID